MNLCSKSSVVNKSSASEECIICHYWYFLVKGFKFNGCHNVLMMSIDINSIVILNIYGVDYRCIIVGISKIEAINLLKNADLREKSGSL